jgi:imidazolonepropionase-like amidohydrolase
METVPSDFGGTRIDLGGRFVIPGLVDMHTHSIGNFAPGIAPQFAGADVVSRWYLYAGVTAFLDLFNAEDYILGLRDQRRSEGGVGAEIFASGPCLTATNGHCSEYGVPTRIVDTPEDARREIDGLAPRRPDVIKIVYDNARYGANSRPTVDRATLEAVITNAKRHGLKTIVHVGTWDDVRDAVMAGAAAVTHTPQSSPVPPDLPGLMAERGVAHIPTLAVHGDLSRIVADPSLVDDPLLVAITTAALRNGYRSLSDTSSSLRGFLAWQRSGIDRISASVAAIAQAGVVILTGTDAGNPGVFQGYSVHRELQLLVESGLPAWDALRAATTHAAGFLDRNWGLGRDDEATFVVLDASPIEDIRNTRRIHSIVQRGVVVDRNALVSAR